MLGAMVSLIEFSREKLKFGNIIIGRDNHKFQISINCKIDILVQKREFLKFRQI